VSEQGSGAAELHDGVEGPPRGFGGYQGDRDAQSLHVRRKVPPQPARDPVGRRREDHLNEVLADECSLDRKQRVGWPRHLASPPPA